MKKRGSRESPFNIIELIRKALYKTFVFQIVKKI